MISHRHFTDEDGCVHPCRCGAAFPRTKRQRKAYDKESCPFWAETPRLQWARVPAHLRRRLIEELRRDAAKSASDVARRVYIAAADYLEDEKGCVH